MRRTLFFLIVLLTSKGFSQKIEYSFSSPNDTTKNYYVTIYPEGPIKGSLILLPGFSELPHKILNETDIYKYASKEGYITFIPALGDWLFFYLDSSSLQKCEQFINEIFKKHKLKTESFFIGGFSAGGTLAFQYTEKAYKLNSKIKPVAVFAADPPLDIERLYTSFTNIDRPKKGQDSENLEKYFSQRIRDEFKSDPSQNPKFFWNISVFSHSDTAHTAIKSLVSVPLRVYNDPDINWYIDTYRSNYKDMNVFDSAAMINWLKSMGNNKAELINALGKGYRKKQNSRNPHSWSIIDSKELVEWMNKNNRGL